MAYIIIYENTYAQLHIYVWIIVNTWNILSNVFVVWLVVLMEHT